MSIYKKLMETKKSKVDLINKSLWFGKRQIISNGVVVCDQFKNEELITVEDLSEIRCLNGRFEIPSDAEIWSYLEYLYQLYKYSVPREKSSYSGYFKALSVDELSYEDMVFNYDRDTAKAFLEGFVLLAGLSGLLQWSNDNHWFWQGKDPDLVVLKQCITK